VLLFLAFTYEGSNSGGDMKLVGACGFELGFDKCIILMICEKFFAFFFALRYYLNIRGIRKKRLPFVPFLYVGWVVVAEICKLN